MAEKEERILIARSTDYTINDTKDGALFEGNIAQHCANVFTRQEAIERIAKAICDGNCENCSDSPMGGPDCIKWLEDCGKIAKAEAALNALLYKTKKWRM